MHSKVLKTKLRKVVSKLMSRVKPLEDLLKFICMMKSASLLVLELGKVQDNKALHRRCKKESIQHHNEVALECTSE